MNIQLINYQMHSNNQTSFKQIRLAKDLRISDNMLSKIKEQGFANKTELFNNISASPYIFHFGNTEISLLKPDYTKIHKVPYGINIWDTINELYKSSIADKIKSEDEHCQDLIDSVQA